MTSRERARSELARLGFTDLAAVGERLGPLSEADRGIVTEALSDFSLAASPDEALESVVALFAACGDTMRRLWSGPMTRAGLIRVLGLSTGFQQFFERHPESVAAAFAHPDAPYPTAGQLRDALFDAVAGRDGEDAVNALRIRYREVLASIAVRDLGAPDPLTSQPAASAALSDLAGATLDAALRLVRREVAGSARVRASAEQIEATRLAIIAMGKTGARELNYLSDVDVIFVAESADTDLVSTDQAIAIATRLASETMKVIDGIAREPMLWEVDANLRPEGRKGALVRTLVSHTAYYERWASGWEFQALIKARPVAGDRDLGQRYRDAIDPFIWRSAAAPDFVASVRRMRERVTAHIPPENIDVQVKLGPGGIRDVEFTVQLLQLVHGQHDDRIRQSATLDALDALARYGYVSRSDAAELSHCYRSLRVIEHRLQLRHLRRTHLMPRDPEEQRIVARATGLVSTGEGLIELWHTIRARVRGLHEDIFYRPLLDAVASVPSEQFHLTSAQAEARLAAIGFRNPAGALSHIEALTTGVTRKAEIQRHLMPVMLQWFAQGTDPDYGLLAFRRISENLGDTHWFLRTLRDATGAAQRLTKVLTSSRFAGDLLDRNPEAVAWFGNEEELVPRTVEVLTGELVALATRHVQDRATGATRVLAVRRREVLRLALAALLDVIGDDEVGAGLAAITTAVFRALMVLVDPKRRYGIEFAVIAMGRYGGGELGFSSDVDVIYVYRPLPGCADQDAQAGAYKVSGELTELATDFQLPFDIDLGLRPEGRNGPPARTLDAYATYYARWSAIWEAQALVRATPVAGSDALMSDFVTLIDPVRYPESIDPMAVREIRRIKARAESERLPRGADPRRHLKLGRGSLSDVEWLVQLRQLQFAARIPELRTTSTMSALDALVSHGLLNGADAAVLRDAWHLASRVRSASTLYCGKAVDSLPNDSYALDGIARILGYAPGQALALENDYLRATRRARAVFDREFYQQM